MKHKITGFNIIELMVAITISATLIATIVKSYAKIYQLYAYNIKYLTLNHDLRLASQLIENDLHDAGVFGLYSLHNANIDSFKKIHYNGGAICNSPWCQLDTSGVGVRSFTTDEEFITSGFSVVDNSEILKIQHGDKLAYLIAKDINSSQPVVAMCQSGLMTNKLFLSNLTFKDDGIDKNSSFYILSSANRAYLLDKVTFASIGDGFSINLVENNGCPRDGDDYIEAHSNVYTTSHDITAGKLLKYDSIDPDIHSMTLTNLITEYFFVANDSPSHKGGLYRVISKGDSLLAPELISANIVDLQLTYLLDYAATLNKSGGNLGARYTICKTSDMVNGRVECKDKWDKVVAVTVDLVGRNNSSGTSAQESEQFVRETVSWKS